MKRIFDIVLSFGLILLCSPLFVVIALLIRCCDPGPIFFSHRRIGRSGNLFSLYKFRSMREIGRAESGGFDPGNISRVTGIGTFLRRTKLDELPQLVNVLKGEMSLVGPRPEVEKWVRVNPEQWERVLTVRPGITDPASVRFRNEEAVLARADDPEEMYEKVILPQKLALYEEYVAGRTMLGDLRILCQTLYAVVSR